MKRRKRRLSVNSEELQSFRSLGKRRRTSQQAGLSKNIRRNERYSVGVKARRDVFEEQKSNLAFSDPAESLGRIWVDKVFLI